MSHVGSCQVQSMQHRLHYRQHSMQHVNIALFAMPTFWAHHQHHTNLPRRAQCQLLLLTLLICLQKQHTSPVGRQPDKTSHIANIQCSMYVALFAMPVFWAHHQHRTTLPRRAQCQLLLLPLLICLQHHRLAGNRIRAPAAEQANTNVLLPTIIHVWPVCELRSWYRGSYGNGGVFY